MKSEVVVAHWDKSFFTGTEAFKVFAGFGLLIPVEFDYNSLLRAIVYRYIEIAIWLFVIWEDLNFFYFFGLFRDLFGDFDFGLVGG